MINLLIGALRFSIVNLCLMNTFREKMKISMNKKTRSEIVQIANKFETKLYLGNVYKNDLLASKQLPHCALTAQLIPNLFDSL